MPNICGNDVSRLAPNDECLSSIWTEEGCIQSVFTPNSFIRGLTIAEFQTNTRNLRNSSRGYVDKNNFRRNRMECFGLTSVSTINIIAKTSVYFYFTVADEKLHPVHLVDERKSLSLESGACSQIIGTDEVKFLIRLHYIRKVMIWTPNVEREKFFYR